MKESLKGVFESYKKRTRELKDQIRTERLEWYLFQVFFFFLILLVCKGKRGEGKVLF